MELFASNIHKRTVNGVVEPTLYLNDKMTNLLENDGYLTYVKPLQDMGIKVLLTVLGDWQGIGVANMNDTQTTQFAKILAHAVEKYGLDGIGFDDEYADYSSTNSTSYSQIIIKLHELMPADKLITVFQWGNYNSINTEARALIDYAYHGYFGSSFITSGIVDKKLEPRLWVMEPSCSLTCAEAATLILLTALMLRQTVFMARRLPARTETVPRTGPSYRPAMKSIWMR